MAISTFDTVVLGMEAILYIFHFSLFWLLCVQRSQKFKGAVYNLFRIIFVADFMFAFTKLLTKIPSFGLWPDFFKANGYLASLNLTSSGYFVFLQFLAHTLISFNRFILFWFPTKYAKIWARQWYTVFVIVVPVFLSIYRLPEPGIYQYGANGEVVVRLLNADAVAMGYIVPSIFYFTCTTIQAIINVLASIKFRQYRKTQDAKLNDARLFYISFIFFAMQLFRSVHNFIRPYFTNNADVSYALQMSVPIVADVYALSGSLSLVLLSPTTRRAYLNYYSRCFGSTMFVSESTQSNVPKVTTTAVRRITTTTTPVHKITFKY